MAVYYTTRVKLEIDMRKYVKNIIDKFLLNINKYQAVTSSETNNIFKVDGSNPLNKNKAGLFHTSVDRGLFSCEGSLPYIPTTISVLCTRVKQPNQVDWNKLLIIMKYRVGTQELCFTLKAEKQVF